MPAATNMSGMVSEYSMDFRDGTGKLIYREASINYPKFPDRPIEPDCNSPDCLRQYRKEFNEWMDKCRDLWDYHEAITEYHRLRCKYCQVYRHEDIDPKYRNGELVPQNEKEALAEIKFMERQINRR